MKLITRLFGKNKQAKALTENSLTQKARNLKTEDISDLRIEDLPYGNELTAFALGEGKAQGLALNRIAHLLENDQASLRQVQQDIPVLDHQLVIATHCENALIFELPCVSVIQASPKNC